MSVTVVFNTRTVRARVTPESGETIWEAIDRVMAVSLDRPSIWPGDENSPADPTMLLTRWEGVRDGDGWVVELKYERDNGNQIPPVLSPSSVAAFDGIEIPGDQMDKETATEFYLTCRGVRGPWYSVRQPFSTDDPIRGALRRLRDECPGDWAKCHPDLQAMAE